MFHASEKAENDYSVNRLVDYNRAILKTNPRILVS